MSSPWLVVGLGNCGKKYNGTRHNLGREIVSVFSSSSSSSRAPRNVVYTLLPETLMNICGRSIATEVKRLEIPLEQLIVVFDDLTLPFGKIRIKISGNRSAHNGLADVVKNVGSKFIRIKIGIAPLVSSPTGEEKKSSRESKEWKEDLPSFVLGKFSAEESTKLREEVIPAVCSAIGLIVDKNVQSAMNVYNG